jgi:hypothetical protein
LAETVTGRSDSGFYIILVASLLGLLLVPVFAKAIRREAGASTQVGNGNTAGMQS